ncbi:hypothetical protein BCR35DRAFT_267036 [Leucosporidium creatinivorum]|uniref:Fatty acid hydroxylase domain-containing protein n=1 Tax=Leucosporidium creatinivorum TaxID=106004 RepID=A0A1Y2F3V0_9BASI|nr:hypothetical protein BCR35DRAFT_267036 [Leucosporidium creatinivorum]
MASPSSPTSPSPLRRQRSSSAGSDASSSAGSSTSDLITYATPAEPMVGPEKRTTRQKVDRRPPSTFYLKPFSKMKMAEKVCNLATCPTEMHELKDEELDRGPIPTQSVLRENIFILSRGLVPLAIQAASYYVFPNVKWPLAVAYPFYVLAFMGFALQVMSRLNYYCVALGVFDEKNIGRDRTPDKSVNGLAKGITAYMFVRTGFTFYLHYNKGITPLTDFSWTFPLRLAAWEITMDYFFYVYHRSCHEIDALWFIHQHHHTTKHPTAILAILAEDYQEYLEIFFIPLAATLLVPMSFSEMYLTLCYTIYVEMLGHSGVRSYWAHPVLWGLKALDMDLAVEDHDIHHRFGKSGKNYGKQTRVWDKLFSTVGERIETYGM